jgi:hypothetical protein
VCRLTPDLKWVEPNRLHWGLILLRNATCILGVVLVAQATPRSVGELLSSPEQFHMQAVTVTGTISNLRGNTLRRGGPIYTFDLGDGIATVHVTSFAKPPCESGAATVKGTFEAWKGKRRVPASYSFEEITAHSVICLPDTVDPRGGKGK